MHSQPCTVSERPVALAAFEWLLSSMDQHVAMKVVTTLKCFAAFVTDVTSVAIMLVKLMLSKSAFVVELFLADITMETSQPGVHVAVTHQGRALGVRLSTSGATEVSLSSVSDFVHFQHLRGAKRLLTDVAGKTFDTGVDLHVVSHMIFQLESLVADTTLVRGEVQVGGRVSLQLRYVREHLTAHFTHTVSSPSLAF